MDIYAEISASMFARIMTKKIQLVFPEGVTVMGKEKDRGFYLSCEDYAKEELIDFLDGKGINWQEV